MSFLNEWLITKDPLGEYIKNLIVEIYICCESYYNSSIIFNDIYRLAARNIIVSISEFVQVDDNIYIILLCSLYENKEDYLKIFDKVPDIIKCKIFDAIDIIIKYTPRLEEINEFYKIRELEKPKKMLDELYDLRSKLLDFDKKND